MKKLTHVSIAVLILGLLLLLKGNSSLVTASNSEQATGAKGGDEVNPRRAARHLALHSAGDSQRIPLQRGIKAIPLVPVVFIVDAVVNNTDPTLTNTDTFNDGETSIAINPANPNEIVITAFSGGWGTNAPLWHSTDSGNIWTKQFTIPNPPPGYDDWVSLRSSSGLRASESDVRHLSDP